MVATTSRSMPWLVKQLRRDHPDILFEPSAADAWNPTQATVYYQKTATSTDQILHELGHALLMHTSYKRDVELLAMERDAWTEAQSIAGKYGLEIDPDSIDDQMNTYRDWLHDRSTCPTCDTNGLQIDDHLYQCLACETTWRVNDARTCGLRRYTVKTK